MQKSVEEKKSCGGRSMLEMLGVLAVIGVLSIGGILGYKYAMNYYQANQIANEVNLMRTDAKVKISQGSEKLALGAPYDAGAGDSLSGGKGIMNFNGYDVAYDCLFGDSLVDDCRDADGYHITLSNVPQGVCKTLATLLNGMNEKRLVEVNAAAFTDAGNCDATENTVAVFFDAEPNQAGFAGEEEGACESDGDCGSGYCVAGNCVECKTSADCEGRLCDQAQGVCVNCTTDADCGSGKHCLNNSVCVECTENSQCPQGVCTDMHTCGNCTDDSDCDGLFCQNNACVRCRNAGDCDEGLACVDGSCGACTRAEECRTGEQCADGACVACIDDTHCGNKKACQDNACVDVECKTNDDCTTAAKPVCNTSTHQCGTCTADEQCGDTVYDHCITGGNKSGQCVQCTPEKPVFNGTTCTACPTSAPKWNEETGACEPCPDRYFWNRNTQECVTYECRENKDCADRTDLQMPYCYMYNGRNCEREFEDDPTYSDGKYFSGTCKDAADNPDTTTVEGYVLSGEERMTWWSAERFCNAFNNRHRAKASVPSGLCPNPQALGGIYLCYVQPETGNSRNSDAVVALRNKYGDQEYIWMEEMQNECDAYGLFVINGVVQANWRYTGNRAMCE